LLASSVKIVFREDALRDIKCCSNNHFFCALDQSDRCRFKVCNLPT